MLGTESQQTLIQKVVNYKLPFNFDDDDDTPDCSSSEVDPAIVELYQRQAQIRKQKLTDLKTQGWLTLYSVLVPEVFCKDLVRLGTVVDGGKWICNPVHIRNFEKCTVYSLGINNEPSFEEGFANFTNQKCLIRSFDKNNQNAKTLDRIKNSNGVFMKALISSKVDQSKGIYNFASLMEIYEDKKIDILKIDIEGFEYEIIDELKSTPMCQILIEVHGRQPKKTYEFLKSISEGGYYLFSYEINGAHPDLSEYSFIHENCLEDYGVNTIFGKYLS